MGRTHRRVYRQQVPWPDRHPEPAPEALARLTEVKVEVKVNRETWSAIRSEIGLLVCRGACQAWHHKYLLTDGLCAACQPKPNPIHEKLALLFHSRLNITLPMAESIAKMSWRTSRRRTTSRARWA